MVPAGALPRTGAVLLGLGLVGTALACEVTGLDEGGVLDDGEATAVEEDAAVEEDGRTEDGRTEDGRAEDDGVVLVCAVEARGAAVQPAASSVDNTAHTPMDTPVRIRMNAKTARPSG